MTVANDQGGQGRAEGSAGLADGRGPASGVRPEPLLAALAWSWNCVRRRGIEEWSLTTGIRFFP